jgi:hypothetical protein
MSAALHKVVHEVLGDELTLGEAQQMLAEVDQRNTGKISLNEVRGGRGCIWGGAFRVHCGALSGYIERCVAGTLRVCVGRTTAWPHHIVLPMPRRAVWPPSFHAGTPPHTLHPTMLCCAMLCCAVH